MLLMLSLAWYHPLAEPFFSKNCGDTWTPLVIWYGSPARMRGCSSSWSCYFQWLSVVGHAAGRVRRKFRCAVCVSRTRSHRLHWLISGFRQLSKSTFLWLFRTPVSMALWNRLLIGFGFVSESTAVPWGSHGQVCFEGLRRLLRTMSTMKRNARFVWPKHRRKVWFVCGHICRECIVDCANCPNCRRDSGGCCICRGLHRNHELLTKVLHCYFFLSSSSPPPPPPLLLPSCSFLFFLFFYFSSSSSSSFLLTPPPLRRKVSRKLLSASVCELNQN